MRIHGVNLSLGYEFDPEWFACGQSPLCKEVDKLVRSGVVVVVAAGNSGYGTLTTALDAPNRFGLGMTINDPGNAERAITVGSTHRDAPHTYGVSYFSSKGPTGDGRRKPDLVAPGERITSCAAGGNLAAVVPGPPGPEHGRVRRGQRHQHGRAARVRRDRRAAVGAAGVHRPARRRQGDRREGGDLASAAGRTSRAAGCSTSCEHCNRYDRGADDMTTMAGLRFWELTFDADGDTDAGARDASSPRCATPASPTWWCSRTAGTTTTGSRRSSTRRSSGCWPASCRPARRDSVGLVGVFWPSQRWSDEPIPDFAPAAPAAAARGMPRRPCRGRRRSPASRRWTRRRWPSCRSCSRPRPTSWPRWPSCWARRRPTRR